MMAEEADKTGITIAIEYHNRFEANVLLSMEEALVLFNEVNRPRMQILADYYHFAVQEEPLSAVAKAAGHIVHLHFAELKDRAFPLEPKNEYRDFFRTLARAGYAGRLSIEAFTKNYSAEAEKALAMLRGLLKEICPESGPLSPEK
jgi:sugar phosphate isomerase/epimerase